MTRTALLADLAYITAHIGTLTISELLGYYERYMNGADEYLLGVEFDDMVYGYFTSEIDRRYCSSQTDHAKNVQYLRFRPHQWGAQEIATREDAICFGSTETVYAMYPCATKKGYNSGYCFEKAVYAHYDMADEWKEDNLPSTEGGDLRLNGKEIQLKYAEKESLATITNTAKIINQIEKLLDTAE